MRQRTTTGGTLIRIGRATRELLEARRVELLGDTPGPPDAVIFELARGDGARTHSGIPAR